jgi:acyl-CoA synthetase (AMP-forming)/AMP-acid ligase II
VVHARPEYRPGMGRRAGRAINVPLAMFRSGLLRPWRPFRTIRQLIALKRWGTTLGGELVSAAARDPDRVAIIDDLGTLTYRELNDRTDRLAVALISEQHGPRPRVAILCRNHRGLVEALIACSKRGAEVVLLNTGMAAPQLHAVLNELWAELIIADAEFASVLPLRRGKTTVVTAWTDGVREHGPTIDDLVEQTPAERPTPPWIQGRTIFLSSGTTGRPKGARRPPRPGIMPLASMLSRIPLRVRETMLIEAPLFHAWGYSALQMALALRATVVLSRRFEPETTLAAIRAHRCSALFTVPIMAQRILDVQGHGEVPSLRVAAVSGSRLPGTFATAFMNTFGVRLYNVYGSTEAAWVSIATHKDLAAHPDTAGRPPAGTVIAILDDRGRPVPAGRVGRIFAGNEMLFEGYTGGSPLEMRDGLLSTGDVGHLDSAGRLYIDGRQDDMVISGGENVMPSEVENVLVQLPQVREAVVRGVPDQEYGQRLAAYVVVRAGQLLDAEMIRTHVREQLARYAVPRDVYFLDDLPRNATGKVMARELAALGTEPA